MKPSGEIAETFQFLPDILLGLAVRWIESVQFPVEHVKNELFHRGIAPCLSDLREPRLHVVIDSKLDLAQYSSPRIVCRRQIFTLNTTAPANAERLEKTRSTVSHGHLPPSTS